MVKMEKLSMTVSFLWHTARDEIEENRNNCKQFHFRYFHLFQFDLWQEPREESASLQQL